MSKKYNLRSTSKLMMDNYSMTQESRVMLTRMPFLDNPNNFNKTFTVKNDKIEILDKSNSKSYDSKMYIVKVLFLIMFLFTIMLTVFYFKDEYRIYGTQVTKRISRMLPNRFSEAKEWLLKGLLNIQHRRISSQVLQQFGTEKQKPKRSKLKNKKNVSYYDIRDFIRDYYLTPEIFDSPLDAKSLSFIEEQCKIIKTIPAFANQYLSSVNASDQDVNIDALPNHASYNEGARILAAPGSESYVEYKAQLGILEYFFGIKYLNIDDLLICRFSPTLCRFFVAGPSSLLQPWSKPGECWSFKGPRASVQIELSQRVHITAVTVEHIPKSMTSAANVNSAPKRFSIIGIDDIEGYKFTRIYLGTYEYQLSDHNIQTFFFSKEDTSLPFKRIEFNVESNHGNENYTCVYRLRVHGYV